MSDFVKRLRDCNGGKLAFTNTPNWLWLQVADKIEQLERELDQLTAEWKEEMELRMSVAHELRAEKALADELYEGGVTSNHFDFPCYKAYRKARGL